MKIIIKFSPEIIIKSRSVRLFFTKILVKNIKTILKNKNKSVSILRCWDCIEIICQNNDFIQVSQILTYIPGIHHILLVENSIILSLEDIYNQIVSVDNFQLSGKTFSIRIKRRGNHIFSSNDIACYLGDKLRHNINNIRVNLTKPDETIYLEIKDNNLFIVIKRYKGLGGLPIGTQQDALSLISGGFDSAVASYMLIRRGCKVHYCFFDLVNKNIVNNFNIEIYKIIYYLWNRFSHSHKVKFIFIDFAEVVQEISSKVKNNYISIILKRMMIRAATSIASHLKIKALITGEVLGQVSSQTLENLSLINSVTSPNHVILRPLISYDKELIIELSRQIGTEIFSKIIPEYCGIISKKSTAKANKQYIESVENCLNISILNKSISQAYIMNVDDILKFIIPNQRSCIIESTTILNSNDIILDIRSKNEQDMQPLHVSKNIAVQKIPFYRLIDEFYKLDQNRMYLLYCERGIMSRLQAMRLYQKGFRNIKIYRFNTD